MNNRQLKFRVWDNEQKKFEYFELHNITVPDRMLYQDKFPVQQFTGLIDAKGKDIYEGDRVRFTYVNVVDMTGGARMVDVFGEVQWCKNIASFGVLYEKYIEFKEITNVEVVGNIFENSELLK